MKKGMRAPLSTPGRRVHDLRRSSQHRRPSSLLCTMLLLAAGAPLASLSGCELSPLHLGRGLHEGELSEDDDGNITPALGGAGGASQRPPTICETTSSVAEIRSAYLAFALDVSGSMGQLDCPFWNHDPLLKWRPVVDAARAFFEDPTSNGLFASLALFPSASEHCDSSSYLTPDVEMTRLPSRDFSDQLRSYEAEVGLHDYVDPMPEGGANWRGGTPTHAVVAAMHEQLTSHQADDRMARRAIVLVTDGMPNGCGEDGAHLENVVREVAQAYSESIPTYVVGVREPRVRADAEPPWVEDSTRVWACQSEAGAWMWQYDDPTVPRPAPDNLTNLNALAKAGGTNKAFLIDTGDPMATKQALQEAIFKIRQAAASCTISIPAHPDGARFEKEKIDVRVTWGGQSARLAYDPLCEPGGGWHYDDEENPSEIVLCDETCNGVQVSLLNKLDVDFLCMARDPVIK